MINNVTGSWSKMKNISYVVKHNLCINCGICVAACPPKAIAMITNRKKGGFYPVIDDDLCTKCGRCLSVCYGYEVDPNLTRRIFGCPRATNLGNMKKQYLCFSNDQKIRYTSSSGGMVTTLLLHALDSKMIDGAILTKMIPGFAPYAIAYIAHNSNDILAGAGSKYCPVSFSEALNLLDENKKYAVVGLPCHIYGLRKLAELDIKIKKSLSLYIGLLCGGMPSYFGIDYLRQAYNMQEHNIKRFEYRGEGWPGRLLIEGDLNNKLRTISCPYPDYWRGFFGYASLYRCKLCHDGFNEYADISLGDAWLPEIIKTDAIGTSILIIRTENGEKFVSSANQYNLFFSASIDYADLLKSQRGLVNDKITNLKAKMFIASLLQKKIPNFDPGELPSPVFSNYLRSIEFFLLSFFASHKRFWKVLEFYSSFKHYVAKLINYDESNK